MTNKSLSIYIHWPFCESKCPYCDFNSHITENIEHGKYLQAYIKELKHYAKLTGERQITSIFFGGGTPSLMKPETIQSILDRIHELWNVAKTTEITIEANPGSSDTNKFTAFKQAGINRISIGIQSFNDESLKFLGRIHNKDEAIQAIKSATQIFDRYSFDLIYTLPNQTVKDWETELKTALKYLKESDKPHISLYQLTIEKGTPFYAAHKKGLFKLPDADTSAKMYETTQNIMERAGIPAYEISNHAGKGCESRHNLTYWRYNDYIGIGAGAHGRLTLENNEKYAIENHYSPIKWLNTVQKTGKGSRDFQKLTRNERLAECLIMGLRIKEGIKIKKLEYESGKLFNENFNRNRLEKLQKEKLITIDKTTIKTTQQGRQKLNSIIEYLL